MLTNLCSGSVGVGLATNTAQPTLLATATTIGKQLTASLTAVRRARSWLGLPYSWAGGNGSGPTQGVCAHNGGDLDCHVVGFDCSGLALYAWSPYESLVHYASTQHTVRQAASTARSGN